MMCLQITASVTFLPLLNDRCSFDLLVYTDVQSAVPMEWSAHPPFVCLHSIDITRALDYVSCAAGALYALLRQTFTLRTWRCAAAASG